MVQTMPKSPKLETGPNENLPEKKSQSQPPVARRARTSITGTTTPAPELAGAIQKAPIRKRKAAAQPPVADPAPASVHERHQRIQTEAYFIAERRGFQGGSRENDWLEAERRIDALMAARKPPA